VAAARSGESSNKMEDSVRKDIRTCGQCEYTGSRTSLRRHVQSKHEFIRYPCDQCEKTFGRPAELRKHVASIHDQVKYPCDLCSYAATVPFSLKKHKETIHEGRVKNFVCDQCDYRAYAQVNLIKHMEARHQGIRYPCDLCEFQATQPAGLRKHMDRHNKGKYKCGMCDFGTMTFSQLTKHTRLTHTGIHYSCDHCDKSYDSTKSLYQHKRRKHPIEKSSKHEIKISYKNADDELDGGMAKEEESEDDGPFQFLDTVLTEETDEYQENGMDENCIKKEFDDS